MMIFFAGVVTSAKAVSDTSMPEGYWSFNSVKCENGYPAKMHYDTAHLTLEFDTAKAELVREGCEITIEGAYSVADKILTIEFGSGSWNACSGAMPTYILNRLEYQVKDNKLYLRGNDLAPFASCGGVEGQMTFVAE